MGGIAIPVLDASCSSMTTRQWLWVSSINPPRPAGQLWVLSKNPLVRSFGSLLLPLRVSPFGNVRIRLTSTMQMEHNVTNGSFDDCIELIPSQSFGHTSLDEQGLAVRDGLLRDRLRDAKRKAGTL